MSDTMRAMEATNDGVTVLEVPVLVPGAGEVRVKVVASTVNPAEEKVLSGAFVGRFLHKKVSPMILGWDFAGTVDAVGSGVSDLSEGDEVWGHLAFSNTQTQGTFAEYITIARDEVATKPADVSFELAAACATPAMTALQSVRDLGRIEEGSRVFIIGAAGGVGSLAVGIAKRLGAHVTGVCSTKDVEYVQSLGADVVIDRKTADPFAAAEPHRVVFDTPAVHSYGKVAKLLAGGGTYVTTLPNLGLMTGMLRSLFTSKRCKFIQVASKRDDLELVGSWLADGLSVRIDSRHKIGDLATALARQTDRARSGRVVVEVADGWPG